MTSLNHVFRTIWSEALGAWIAVSEITKSRGKRSASNLIRAIRTEGSDSEVGCNAPGTRLKSLILAVACCFAVNAQANPVGGTVVNGQAGFSTAGNTLTVTNTPGTIINWQGFSIGANEATHFAQQSASSTVLNRVVTNTPSVILGKLSSNGQVFLVNANGIMFGAGSTVDVAGLVATTLNLSNADFLAGKHNYTAVTGAGNVSNAGNINAQQNGYIYLIAPNVENSGIITAPNGEILLAAGSEVQLVNSLDPNLRVTITAPAGDATNVGQLIAESGSLGLFGTMVKNSGVVSADSATMQGGKIVFKASNTTILDAGSVTSATGTTGGTIAVQGNNVGLIGNASVDASGTNGGGTVLVGGGAHGANPSVQNSQLTYVDSGASIKADATQIGNGGRVVVWSDNATQFGGNISARGGALSGNGGWVETSGKQWLGFAGLVDTTAAYGTMGSLLLDPMDVTISTAGDTPSMAWNGATFTFADPSTGNLTSNLNVTTLTNQLALTNVTVNTTGGVGTGNIDVQTPIAWASANSLTLNATSGGAITTTTGSTITNTGTGGLTMTTAGGGITLNANVTLAGGAFTANAGGAGAITIGSTINTGSGAVSLTSSGSSITETGSGLISTTGLLTTSAYAATTLNGANSVGSFSATNSMTGGISLVNAAPGAGWLTINGISSSSGAISVTNAGVISITGAINGGTGALNLTTTGASGWIREVGPSGLITAGTLTTNNSSSAGTSLNGGTNMIGALNATDVGMVNVQNGTALNITGITASDVMINNTASTAISGAVTASNSVSMTAVGISNNSTITGSQGVSLNAGTGTLSNIGGGVSISNGGGASTGAIALAGDAMVLSNGVAIPGSVIAGAGTVKINTSTAANAINLGSSSDVANQTLELSNAELATISTTGPLLIGGAGNNGAITVSAPLTLAQNTTLMNGSGGIAINGAINAGTRNLTLDTAGSATQTAGITAAGLELLTGSYALNAVNSIATVAGNATSISLTNNAALSVGTVNTAGLTASGAISLTAAGTITQTAAISTPGSFSASSTGGTTLNGANTVGSFGAANSTSGNIAFTNNGGFTALGITNTVAGGSISLTDTAPNTMLDNSAGSISTNNGAIALTADKMILGGSTGTISAGTGNVTLQNFTATNAIDLGSTVDTTANTLELSSVDLGSITAGSLTIGSAANSGAITVSASFSPAIANIALVNGAGGITVNAGIVDSLANLTLDTAGALAINNTIMATSITGLSGAGVTLGASASLAASSSGNAIVLSAGKGNFINNAGATVLNLTGGGRWLVYSTAPGLDQLGGLDSGNPSLWGKTYASYAPGSVTEPGNRFLYSSVATITPTVLAGLVGITVVNPAVPAPEETDKKDEKAAQNSSEAPAAVCP